MQFFVSASTCQTISPTNTLKITQWFGGALLKFTCAAMYQLKGEKTLTCDGSEWSAPTPLCIREFTMYLSVKHLITING
jgi:hypothetical protein